MNSVLISSMAFRSWMASRESALSGRRSRARPARGDTQPAINFHLLKTICRAKKKTGSANVKRECNTLAHIHSEKAARINAARTQKENREYSPIWDAQMMSDWNALKYM